MTNGQTPTGNRLANYAALLTAIASLIVGVVGGVVALRIADAETAVNLRIADAENVLTESISDARIDLERSISESQLAERYVRIAVDLLSSDKPPEDDVEATKADLALRKWAVDILAAHTPDEAPITADLRTALEQGDAQLLSSLDIVSIFGDTPPALADLFGISGELPEGCEITTYVEHTVRATPGAVSSIVGSLPPGTYDIYEVRLGVGYSFLESLSWYRVDDGWIQPGLFDAIPDRCKTAANPTELP